MLVQAVHDVRDTFMRIGEPVVHEAMEADLTGCEWTILVAFSVWFFGSIGVAFAAHPIFGLTAIILWAAQICAAFSMADTEEG